MNGSAGDSFLEVGGAIQVASVEKFGEVDFNARRIEAQGASGQKPVEDRFVALALVMDHPLFLDAKGHKIMNGPSHHHET
ncbi:MAG: hypothetical protein ABL904_18195 [Hyphomicrobiaceae bacterium]